MRQVLGSLNKGLFNLIADRLSFQGENFNFPGLLENVITWITPYTSAFLFYLKLIFLFDADAIIILYDPFVSESNEKQKILNEFSFFENCDYLKTMWEFLRFTKGFTNFVKNRVVVMSLETEVMQNVSLVTKNVCC